MKFLAEDDSLTIRLEGSEMLLGLKHKLVLPRAQMVDLVWSPEFNYSDLVVRLAGASVPKLLYAGHFRDLDTKEQLFLYLKRPKGLPLTRTMRDANVLAITMRDYSYAKVLVSCQPEIGASLMNWFKNTVVSSN